MTPRVIATDGRTIPSGNTIRYQEHPVYGVVETIDMGAAHTPDELTGKLVESGQWAELIIDTHRIVVVLESGARVWFGAAP